MIPAVQQNFPTGEDILVDRSGRMTQVGRFFWLSLWQRTGNGTGVPMEVDEGLTGTGSAAADALELAKDINVVTTTPASTGCIFPALQPGQIIVVMNHGANALAVYPPSDARIDALGLGAAYSLAAGKMQIFWCVSQTQYYSTQLG